MGILNSKDEAEDILVILVIYIWNAMHMQTNKMFSILKKVAYRKYKPNIITQPTFFPFSFILFLPPIFILCSCSFFLLSNIPFTLLFLLPYFLNIFLFYFCFLVFLSLSLPFTLLHLLNCNKILLHDITYKQFIAIRMI